MHTSLAAKAIGVSKSTILRDAPASHPARRPVQLRALKLRGSLIGNRTLNREHAEKIISWIYEGGQLFALFSICSTRADH
jgi:hypothetical protein